MRIRLLLEGFAAFAATVLALALFTLIVDRSRFALSLPARLVLLVLAAIVAGICRLAAGAALALA